ncbi:MAG TPA: hypothetical protein VF765_04105 [Polyangiaceae bacterium]
MAALPRPSPGTLSALGSGTYTAARAARAPVVVIERDARTRGTIASTLGDFRVHEAENLSSASALVSEVQPRAIVCGMGFESLELLCFTRWLRITFGRSIALIVLTPRGDAQRAIRALPRRQPVATERGLATGRAHASRVWQCAADPDPRRAAACPDSCAIARRTSACIASAFSAGPVARTLLLMA